MTINAICLMGPTASGKTDLALQLAQQFPCEIISVDSSMIYKCMDIGTAKPDEETLKKVPHHLIDILDPSEAYSAGDFRDDAVKLIREIHARGKTPLLVGGTMMYFKVLQQGMAKLPSSDPEIREQLQNVLDTEGLEVLYKELQTIDPASAEKINENDKQRIMRAIEVYKISGVTLSELQETADVKHNDINYINLAIAPEDRGILHQRIEKRFDHMLQNGFVEEVKSLYARDDLHKDLPSMRSVGYRQVWQFLDGDLDKEQMRFKGIVATRQLAKRQYTWLRSWPDLTWFDSESPDLLKKTLSFLAII